MRRDHIKKVTSQNQTELSLVSFDNPSLEIIFYLDHFWSSPGEDYR